MKVLVISRPVYDNIIPLVEFPNDGDLFNINQTVNTLTNIGSIIAVTLAKYNVDLVYNGAIGEDDTANRIKEILNNNSVNINFLETNFNTTSFKSYKIYNAKTNKFTTINDLGSKCEITKFKYEFIPDVVIMDKEEYNANLAAINNYPNASFIFFGDKFTKESDIYLKKCKYVIATLDFASKVTGVTSDLTKQKNIVDLYQKYIDLYPSNLIIKLNNFDILYCINDEVRLIKNTNTKLTNKDNIYCAVLIYFLILNVDIENSIKLTNKVMLSSDSQLDLLLDIPNKESVDSVVKEYLTTVNINNSSNTNQNNMNNAVQNQSNNVVNDQNTVQTTVNNNQNVEQLNINNGVNNGSV